MPFKTDWHNEKKTIIVSSAHAPWTWDEYVATGEKVYEMFDEVTHGVVHITDYSLAAHVNPPTAGVRNLPRLGKFTRHDNFRFHIDVGITKPLGKMLSNIFASTYGKHHTAATLAEALTMIEEDHIQ